MDLSSIKEGELKAVFDDLEEAFQALNIDFYLIGALARDIWYARGNKNFRTTNDVDFAIMVSNKDDYEAVREYLKEQKGYSDTKNNAFVILTPAGIQIDILPFGGIEINDEVRFNGTGFTSIKVNGFREVYQAGTQEIQLTTGHSFKVATLPAIVLLKLIAYNDRPEIRLRDAPDVINILCHFFDLQADLIYDRHADLFGGEELELEEIGTIVTGREMREIVADNHALNTRLAGILEGLIEAKENSPFIRMMVTESSRSVESVLNLMKRLLTGFKQIDTE